MPKEVRSKLDIEPRPQTRSQSNRQAVEEEEITPYTINDPASNLVTGNASNETNPTTNTNTNTTTAAAAATAAAAIDVDVDVDVSIGPGSSRAVTTTAQRTLFPSAESTAAEATIGNEETEQATENKKQEPTSQTNSNNNTATMSASPFDAGM